MKTVMAIVNVFMTLGQNVNSLRYEHTFSYDLTSNFPGWILKTSLMFVVAIIVLSINACYWQGYESRSLKVLHVIGMCLFGSIFHAFFLLEIGFKQEGYLMQDYPEEP